jgi:hypothetical protein
MRYEESAMFTHCHATRQVARRRQRRLERVLLFISPTNRLLGAEDARRI